MHNGSACPDCGCPVTLMVVESDKEGTFYCPHCGWTRDEDEAAGEEDQSDK